MLKTYLKSSLPLLVVLGLVLALISHKNSETVLPDTIEWRSLSEAQTLVAKKHKPILIRVEIPACVKCENMEKHTFQDQKIVEMVNRDYYAVRLNASSADSINFGGKTLSIKHLVRDELKVTVYPSTVYLDGNKVAAVIPFYKSPQEMVNYLEYYKH